MYYEDVDEVSGALKVTRLNKKKAADDARLLANRIALLKMEEKKAWKKIQETKRKAEQVMVVRNRNHEDRQRKEQIRQMREDDAAMKAEKNAQRRLEKMNKAATEVNQKTLKIIEGAAKLKEDSLKNAIAINKQRENEAQKNSGIKEMIRRQKAEGEERRALE